MTGKPTTLGDLAHVFHGVGNADIFTAEKVAKANNPKEVEDCRVIKASDVTSQRPWQQPDTIMRMKVSKRLVSSTKRRGLGQSCILQTGDLLLTTRGKPKVSPMITHEMTKNGAIVAGPEILVIRAKEGVYCATLREAMRQKSATLYFAETTTKKNKDKAEGKGWDKSGVLSKEAASGLPVPEGLTNMPPRFGQDVEILSHKAESLITGIQSLNHAIIEAARWRADMKFESIEIPVFDYDKVAGLSWEKAFKDRYDEIKKRETAEQNRLAEKWVKSGGKTEYDWSYRKPFDQEVDALIKELNGWASEGLIKCLKNIGSGTTNDADTELMCLLLSGTKSCEEAKRALLKSRKLMESTTILAHERNRPVSYYNSSESIRSLMACCAENAESLIIMEAETGNLAAEVLHTSKKLKRLSLIESTPTHRKVAKALCDLCTSSAGIEEAEKAFRLPRSKTDIILLEASGFDIDNKELNDQAKRTSAELFQWHEIGDRIAEKGYMLVHVPTTHWRLLASVTERITMVIQLPPLSIPIYGNGKYRTHVPCDQGLMVILKPGFISKETVKVVDATKLNQGAAASSLTGEQIKILCSFIKGEEASHETITQTDVPCKEIFKEMSVWPGISTLMKKNVDADDLAQAYTLETLVEEFKSRHFLWKKTETEIFRDIGLQPDF
jgi:hypothetical protein